MRRVEAHDARERGGRVPHATGIEQRFAEDEQGLELVGVGREERDQQVERLGGPGRGAQHARELELGLLPGRHCIDGGEQLRLRGGGIALAHEQPREFEAHHAERGIEVECAPVRVHRRSHIAQAAEGIAGPLVEVRPLRREGARARQRFQRRRRVSIGDAGIGGEHQRVEVARALGQQLVRRLARLATAPEREQRANAAQSRAPRVHVEVERLGIALDRLAVEAARRVHVAHERQSLDPVGAPPHRPGRLGPGPLVLAHGEELLGRGIGARRHRTGHRRHGDRRGEGGEHRVEEPRVERELLHGCGGALLAAQVRDHGEVGILVHEVDRELELLRHVVRVQFERPLGLAQRPLEIAEVREREAHVVVRLRVLGARLDGAGERGPGVLEPLELGEHEPDAVPGHRLLRFGGEHVPVRLERELEPLVLVEQQREVEPRLDERGLDVERRAKRVDRVLALSRMIECDPQVARGERVPGIGLERLAVALGGFLESSILMQRDAALVPELRARGLVAKRLVVHGHGLLHVARQQVHLGHRLTHEVALLAALEGDPVFLERVLIVPLLPEGHAEVEVRELPFLGHRHQLLRPPLGAARHQQLVGLGVVAVDGEVGLGASERRVELHGPLGGQARLFVASHVAEHEAGEVDRVRVPGVELDGALESLQRVVVQPLVVEHLAPVEVHERGRGVEPEGPVEPA